MRNGRVDVRYVVTGIHTPKTRAAVERLMTLAVGVIHAFRGHDKTRVFFELPLPRKRHPESIEVIGYQVVMFRAHDRLTSH